MKENTGLEMNQDSKKEQRKNIDFHKTIQIIVDAVRNFPEKSEECFEKTRNSRLECAIDLIAVIDMALQMVRSSNNKENIGLDNYEKLMQYKQEIVDIGVKIRQVINDSYKIEGLEENDPAIEKLEENSRSVLEELSGKAGSLRSFIEGMIN